MSSKFSKFLDDHPGYNSRLGWGSLASLGRPERSEEPSEEGPPAEAIELLRNNPHLAPEFDRKFGKGAAARINRFDEFDGRRSIDADELDDLIRFLAARHASDTDQGGGHGV